MLAAQIQASSAVLAARERRIAAAQQKSQREQWFIDEVVAKVDLTLKQRITLATEWVRTKVVSNISRPVTKVLVGGRVVTDESSRSKKGEYPKADTTLLMKTIFAEVKQPSRHIYDGYIGTPLDYGLILEISERLDRSFLKRTFHAELPRVRKILTGPIV